MGLARRCFEDVEIGSEIPKLVKGPITATHMVRWVAATEAWHRIHYDYVYTTQHEKLPGLLVSGTSKQQFIMQMLTDWARPDGWVAKVRFQFRAMNLMGETLTIWGRVTSRRETTDFGLAGVALGIVNEHGVESAPGTALVAFPYRSGPPLPYPFDVSAVADLDADLNEIAGRSDRRPGSSGASAL